MSEQEDKGELKDRDYLKEVADWMDRMPCDWRVCQESLGRYIEGISKLEADPKVIYVNLCVMANLTAAQIMADEKDANFDELHAMAAAVADDIMVKENMRANVAKKQAEVFGSILGRGIPPFLGKGYL